jgi:hypothetical protein
MSQSVQRTVDRSIAFHWAAFWLWFGLASGIGEDLSPLGVLIHAAAPGLVFLASALVAWQWQKVGGWLLVAWSVVVLVGYPIMVSDNPHFGLRTITFIYATMAVPPLLAGWLLLRTVNSGSVHPRSQPCP